MIKIQEQKKTNQNLEFLISSLKPPIFWKEKPILIKQLKIWKKGDLIKIVKEINEIELECKKNDKISLINLLNFLISIYKKASSFS